MDRDRTRSQLRRLLEAGDGSVSTEHVRQCLQAGGTSLTSTQARNALAEEFPGVKICGYDPGLLDGVQWTAVGLEALRWEQRLTRDGLSMDRVGTCCEIPTDPAALERMANTQEPLAAGHEYLSRGQTHLLDWPWQSPRERSIWALHLQGVSNRTIGLRYAMRHQTVARVVNRHRRHCGLRPARPDSRLSSIEKQERVARRDRAVEYVNNGGPLVAGERRAWFLVELENWPAARAAAEIGVTAAWVRRTVARHRKAAGLA